jgi:hypothetical protein
VVRGGVDAANPFRSCCMRLGMESWYFVETKSFIFLMVKGSIELRVVKKRNEGFAGSALLGCC